MTRWKDMSHARAGALCDLYVLWLSTVFQSPEMSGLALFKAVGSLYFFRELEPIHCEQVYCEAINPCFDDKHLSDFKGILMFQLATLHIAER